MYIRRTGSRDGPVPAAVSQKIVTQFNRVYTAGDRTRNCRAFVCIRPAGCPRLQNIHIDVRVSFADPVYTACT